ncbi:MAG: molybdenum cofactor biosynthesis protein MoaE [Parvibaculaceae bacterium]
MIRVQQDAFDASAELKAFTRGSKAGGTVMFLGTVRDLNDGKPVSAMTLEHYQGMTEKALAEIDDEAQKRWPLEKTLIIHRYGRLMPGDDIVLVLTASAHREAAFESCAFLIDWLKTKAPFWKLEESGKQTQWVEAKVSDDEAAARWSRKTK